jgi:hypothetical protein
MLKYIAPSCSTQDGFPLEWLIMPVSALGFPRLPSFVPLAAALLLLAGCASVTPIGELLDNPSRYDGKTVQIQGEVKGSAGGLGVGAYEVKDKTGTLPVVSQEGSPPRSGAEIRVKGKFDALITLGSKALAVLREESRSIP